METCIDALEIEKALADLPAPVNSYEQKGVQWDVYIAKKLFSSGWENKSLYFLVQLCRRSFLRYGEVSLEDDFDKKALVLLARAKYVDQTIEAEEWLSIRFIPASGDPYLSEDLKLRLVSGLTFFDVIKEKLFVGTDQASDYLLTISRICGIPPYNRKGYGFVGKKLRYTALTSAWIFLTLVEILKTAEKYQYITALFHQSIFPHVKQKEKNDHAAVLDLPNAHEVLGLPLDYFVNIEVGNVAYMFPTYFYNLPQLVDWLEKIVNEDVVDINTINKFLQKPIDWGEIRDKITGNKVAAVDCLKGLGKFLMLDGQLDTMGCSGAELRERLEREVEKSFSLKLFSLEEFGKKVKLYLKEINSTS